MLQERGVLVRTAAFVNGQKVEGELGVTRWIENGPLTADGRIHDDGCGHGVLFGLTFDMSGSWRLADNCPLDGGVRHLFVPTPQHEKTKHGEDSQGQ
jgi:hypothetical protein